MAISTSSSLFLVLILCLVVAPAPAAAFGAGNIASISAIEGKNWRHGDIEDILKTVAFLHGRKWSSMMVRRVYFGNWLRDYSQAVDVGTLKGIQADTIRILVWVLSFMSFGYATGEFEVTSERLAVYSPHEHIDNPKDYADNVDARQYDPRLRPPVRPEELAIDPNTGMKNYIANEYGGWATSSGYIKFSLARSIHFGRLYTSGSSTRGNDDDLYEALRCLGQALHCLEDFSAHSNYCELALIEMGYRDVFPYSGSGTAINLRGRHAYPLVTGTFGAVDFLHSVLGEATDHFTQSEVNDLDNALGSAQSQSKMTGSSRSGPGSGSGSSNGVQSVTGLLSQLPSGMGGGFCQEAERLQAQADAQENFNNARAGSTQSQSFAGPPGAAGGPPGPGIPGMDPTFDPAKTIASIYPILEFRDRIAKFIASTIEKIPGLEALCERISETVMMFVLGLLAPFIRPIIDAVSKQLQSGSTTVVDASGRHQFEVWTDPYCSDPTHSMLSKDHFSNILNGLAGQLAASVLQYVVPRVVYAWEHTHVPVDEVLNDVVRVLHHPAIRDPNCEIHRNMFDTVDRWVKARPDRGSGLNHVLGSQSVRDGKNHKEDASHGHTHASMTSYPSASGHYHGSGNYGGSHGGNHGGGSHGSGNHGGGAAGGIHVPHMPQSFGAAQGFVPQGLGLPTNLQNTNWGKMLSGGLHSVGLTRDVDGGGGDGLSRGIDDGYDNNQADPGNGYPSYSGAPSGATTTEEYRPDNHFGYGYPEQGAARGYYEGTEPGWSGQYQY
ncbi:MAG: hypothetical protein M1825_002998 [Sarcosagium campestre]|nr:MAG: hypothetical protein M1825_002998 [Sarcosagium campestre]